VFLSVAEVEKLLGHVRQAKDKRKDSSFPWVFPMFAFCGYTGCRRSEILRSHVEDIDFERNEVAIREKKKDRSKEETFRHVPMAVQLRQIMEQWLRLHPGGDVTFCRAAGMPLTVQMADHYFKWNLNNSQWAVLRGYHVFRHSLISNLASRGVTEQVIMGIVGHLNAETTRRYLHLYPSSVRLARREL
jgi:integrase